MRHSRMGLASSRVSERHDRNCVHYRPVSVGQSRPPRPTLSAPAHGCRERTERIKCLYNSTRVCSDRKPSPDTRPMVHCSEVAPAAKGPLSHSESLTNDTSLAVYAPSV